MSHFLLKFLPRWFTSDFEIVFFWDTGIQRARRNARYERLNGPWWSLKNLLNKALLLFFGGGDGGIGVGGIYLPLNRFPWFWQDFWINISLQSCSACAQVTSHQRYHQRYHHRCNCNHGGNAAGHLQDGVSWQNLFGHPKLSKIYCQQQHVFKKKSLSRRFMIVTSYIFRIYYQHYYDLILNYSLLFLLYLLGDRSLNFLLGKSYDSELFPNTFFRFLSKNLVSWLVDPPTPPTYPPSEIRV